MIELCQEFATANPRHKRLMLSLEQVQSWQPRQIGPSGYIDHLLVLAWLVFTLQPRQSIGLGIGQGMAYFTLCQSACDAGYDARLFGIDLWRPQSSPSAAAVPDELRHHNEQHYASVSRLICADPAGAADIFDSGDIDLLLVDQDLSPDLLDALHSQWFPLMSERGVIVLRGLAAAREDAATGMALEALTQSKPHFHLTANGGLLLLLVGGYPPEDLVLAAALSDEDAGRMALEQEFARISAPLRARVAEENENVRFESIPPSFVSPDTILAGASEARNAVGQPAPEVEAERASTIAALATRDTALAAQAQQLEEVRLAHETQTAALERSSAEVLTATRTAEAFHAALEQRNQQYKAATAALAERVRELKEVRLAYDTQTAALKRSSAKVMTLTRAAEALNVALKQRSAQYEATIAALTAKAHAAQTALAADLAQAKAELGLANATSVQKDAEIMALRTSTSWKVTAPLRIAKNILTGQ